MLEVKPNTVTFGACEHRLVTQFGGSRDGDQKNVIFFQFPKVLLASFLENN